MATRQKSKPWLSMPNPARHQDLGLMWTIPEDKAGRGGRAHTLTHKAPSAEPSNSWGSSEPSPGTVTCKASPQSMVLLKNVWLLSNLDSTWQDKAEPSLWVPGLLPSRERASIGQVPGETLARAESRSWALWNNIHGSGGLNRPSIKHFWASVSSQAKEIAGINDSQI